jgi:hypothetical protein
MAEIFEILEFSKILKKNLFEERSRNARETLEKRFMNTRITSKNHVNI